MLCRYTYIKTKRLNCWRQELIKVRQLNEVLEVQYEGFVGEFGEYYLVILGNTLYLSGMM